MERYTQLLFKQKHPSWMLFVVLGLAVIAVLVFVIDGRPLATQVGKQQESPQTLSNLSSEDLTANLFTKTEEWKQAKGKQKAELAQQLQDIAETRKTKLLAAMEQNPQQVLDLALSAEQRSQLPPESQRFIEEHIDITGTLEVLHEDDFENKNSRDFYFLNVNNQRFSLYTSDSFPPLLSSSKVHVTGVKLDDKVAFTTKHTLEVLEAATPDSLGEQKTLVLLANFQNTAQPDFTTADADTVMGGVDFYYSRASYEKTAIVWNTYGWYRIALDQTCDFNQVTNEAIMAADPDVNFSLYGRLVVIAPVSYSCGWNGISTIGKYPFTTADGTVQLSYSVISDFFAIDIETVGHEFGHQLGLHHASFLNCGTSVISSAGCAVEEYEDKFDIMGKDPGHLNAAHEEYIGWFEPTNILAVTQDGTYSLEPIETASAGLKALKIQRAANDYLFIEYRQRIGIDVRYSADDDVFSGALLHTLLLPNKTALLDATPPRGSLYINPTLHVSGSFTDPASGTTVSVTSQTPSALVVNITLGNTDFIPPTASITLPTVGSVLSNNVTISADASDASDIERVEFYKTDTAGRIQLIGLDALSPYSVQWDTTRAKNGSNYLYLVAYDNAVPQNSIDTWPSNIEVQVQNVDAASPTVLLSSPQAGLGLVSPISVIAQASDNIGIYKVEFRKDNEYWPFFTAFDEPYSTSAAFLPGTHVIQATALDYVGNSSSTDWIDFTVLQDTDGDGFPNAVELYLGTDPNLACGANAWPPDFNDDGVVHIEDVTAVSSRFGAKVGDPKYSPRYEVASQDGVIHIDDVSKVAGAFGETCGE